MRHTPPAPAPAAVVDVDAVVAIFGQFDLHDAELRTVHVGHARNGLAAVSLDFVIPGELAIAPGSADRGAEYRVTLRCDDVSDLTLADFMEQNVVAEYAFTVDDPAAADGRALRVTITCSPGCDVELRCRAIAVAGVHAVG